MSKDRRRLYTVTLSTQVVVLAENMKRAEQIAEGDSEFDMGDTHCRLKGSAKLMHEIPPGWKRDCIPFGTRSGEPDWTIGEWMSGQATSEGKADE